MHITYHNTTPLGFTFDDLQHICYHLQRAEKENRLVNEDMSTLLKVRAMISAAMIKTIIFYDEVILQ